jgi:L-methionine (R)-S-oxide reductase
MDIEQVSPGNSKRKTYEEVYAQAQALCEGETNWQACVSNISSLVHFAFQHHWTGVYLFQENQLVLHSFQGPVACTRIDVGKGVCGTAFQKEETVLVPNVHEFEGHIACSSETNSEIVLPLFDANQMCIGVFDVDSIHLDAFDALDKEYLEAILSLLTHKNRFIHE